MSIDSSLAIRGAAPTKLDKRKPESNQVDGRDVPDMTDPLFTEDQAAKYLGIAPATLSVWRCTKRYDLNYIKLGRLVRYRKSACDAFLVARTVEQQH